MLRRTRVDALIVQDLGVFYLAKKMLPGVELHASTQMAVHNAEGAKFLQRLGFKRVVLARELSLREIQAVAEAAPDLDLEVFVHGALCYSYSGQCLFSALEYGKSANRGRCVYPCRAEFAVEEENDNRGAREDRHGLAGNCDAGRAGQRGETEGYGADGTDWYGLAGGCGGLRSHLFSMKDLALEEAVLKIPALSLKIEGRKKSPLYVAAVTNYYRHILDGRKKDLKEAEDIRQIFRGHGAGSILTARIKTWLTHILSGTGGCLSAKWNASGEIVWGLRLRMRWLVMTACRLTRQATKTVRVRGQGTVCQRKAGDCGGGRAVCGIGTAGGASVSGSRRTGLSGFILGGERKICLSEAETRRLSQSGGTGGSGGNRR